MTIPLFLIIGLVFGALAGAAAFLITWLEWEHHGFQGSARWREPVMRGIFAFAFFLLLSLALALLL